MTNSSFCGDFNTDNDIDAIFAAAFDVLHQSAPAPTDVIQKKTTDPTSSTPTATCNVNARFAPPKTNDKIKQLRNKGISKKTLEDTHYCNDSLGTMVRLCQTKQAEIFLKSRQCSKPNCLTSFVLEVCKENGEEYSPDTLHHLCCGIMWFQHPNG